MFGDIIVTLDDVNLWLDAIPDMCGATQTRRNYYAENHDIANKIKLSKLDGSFEKVIKGIESDLKYAKSHVDIFKTVYTKDPLELNILKCPDYFHSCNNPECEVYIKRIKHEKHAADYAKRKKYKRHT
jgi:hypothetical protein